MNPHDPESVNKKLLKTSLSTVWSHVYIAALRDLDLKKIQELRVAISDIRSNWPENDSYYGRANLMCEWVAISGILSEPPRKPRGTEAIMQDCQILGRYLDLTSDDHVS